jgi:hypothetical protein
VRVGDPADLPLGSLDSDVLLWTERHSCRDVCDRTSAVSLVAGEQPCCRHVMYAVRIVRPSKRWSGLSQEINGAAVTVASCCRSRRPCRRSRRRCRRPSPQTRSRRFRSSVPRQGAHGLWPRWDQPTSGPCMSRRFTVVGSPGLLPRRPRLLGGPGASAGWAWLPHSCSSS